jgi:preprotein translocase subunit SecB
MSEEQNPTPEAAAAAAPEGQPRFVLQKMYVKDVSFEVPGAPEVFKGDGQGEIKLNLAQQANPVEDGLWEVVLSVTVTASADEKTAYLAEVQQAGLFSIAGLSEQQLQAALNTLCPHSLFPYAARTITGLVADGGFPPLVLQPINFDQVYQQRLREAGAAAQPMSGDMEVQGNA